MANVTLRGRLLDFLANLPGTDGPASRKALIEFTGFQSLSIYLDWQGSNFEFCERLLDKLGAEGPESLVAFLEALGQRSEWIGIDRQPILRQLQDEVAALTATGWQEHFPRAEAGSGASARTRQRVVVAGGSRAKDLSQSAPADAQVDQNIQIDDSSVGNVNQRVVD